MIGDDGGKDEGDVYEHEDDVVVLPSVSLRRTPIAEENWIKL